MPDFEILELKYKKKVRHIWNKLPRNCLIAKFGVKIKIHIFGTLGPKMSSLGDFGLDYEKNILIFEISTLELV